jgi:conjugal transfer pilus assembly protein TraW
MIKSSLKIRCWIRQISALLAGVTVIAQLAHAQSAVTGANIRAGVGATSDVLAIVREQNQQIRAGALKAQSVFGGPTTHDNGKNPATEAVLKAKTAVFISMSMPDRELSALLDEGRGRRDVVFFLRGLEGNNGRKTNEHIKAVTDFKNRLREGQPVVAVLPQAFARWDVTRVPVVMHESVVDHKWYRVDGAISIESATRDIDAGVKSRATGMTWPVSEQDLADVFRDRMQHYDWKAWQGRTAANMKRQMDLGTPLPLAQRDTRYTVDLSVTFPQDIRDQKGNLIIAKGTRYNPLAKSGLPGSAIVIIDPADERQIAMARTWMQRYPHGRLLVTHFDEEGLSTLVQQTGIKPMMLDKIIVKRFQLQAAPSLLTAENGLLVVQTFSPRVEGGM